MKKQSNNSFVRNILTLSSAEVISKMGNFGASIFAARYFSVQDFGLAGYASSLISYFYLITNFGFDVYALREGAKNITQRKSLLGNILALKLILSVLSYIVILILALMSESVKRELILLYGAGVILSVFNIYWYFQAEEDTRKIFVSRTLEGALYPVILVLFALATGSIIALPLAMIFSQSIAYLYYFDKSGFPGLSSNDFKAIWSKSYPIGLTSVFIVLYYNIDLIVLENIKGAYEAGIFFAAAKTIIIFESLQVLTNRTILPSIVRLKKTEYINQYVNSLIKILITLGLFIAALVSIFPDFIINVLFGREYTAGIPVLGLLSAGIFFVYFQTVTVPLLTAYDKQKKHLIAVIIAALFSMALNFVLVPYLGAEGSAYASVTAHAISGILVFIFSLKEAGIYKLFPIVMYLLSCLMLLKIKEVNIALLVLSLILMISVRKDFDVARRLYAQK